jgi:hypothetical protein
MGADPQQPLNIFEMNSFEFVVTRDGLAVNHKRFESV